ncbi:ATP synthase F0 subcomplex subunit H atp14 [Friedmanniomyces endolithicus]|nr:ATP synthase F0 subcomplex subunit H atp14 [Friedmanniomyces endolithicus]
MLGQSMRTLRQLLVRAARQQHALTIRRTLITPTAIRQADLVQDMYLKELKAYKTPPVKANDAEGQVQKFAMPKPPTSPEEADIANDLKAYEDQVPEVEGQAVAGSAGAPEEDWFEDPEDEADAPSGAAH